jgi:methyl coenzyme M reductase alpha subunit
MSSDEIWLTNSISGIVAVSDYRKKKFSNEIAKEFVRFLNIEIENI